MPASLATVRIGAVRVGIPVEAVLQALPAAGLAMLPRRRGALCGVVEHDGILVPVVDLARWVDVGGAPPAAEDAARVLLLRDGARRIGLRVDAVGGLAEAGEGGLSRLLHDADPEEVFHTAVKARGTDAILSVLDTARLAALAVAWHQDEEDAAGAGAGAATVTGAEPGAGQAGASITVGLLQAGGVALGLPVANLAEVLPLPALSSGGFGLAHCTWRDRTLAVLPPGAPGDGRDGRDGRDGGARDAPPAKLLAVVEYGGAALGLQVDAVRGLQAIALAADAPPAAQGLAVACHDADGGAVLLLDIARLFARFPEAALARRSATGDGRPRAPAGAGRSNTAAYVVFQAGGMLATAIDALEEILPLPAGAGPTLAWRGKTLAVTDLRPADAPGPAQAMVVRRGERHLACVVSHVSLLVPPRGGRLYRMGAGARAVEFITVGEGAGQASYRTVDLAALAGEGG
ncbi:MAG: chemotaxis protein CheW [Janthinobacterium lividum]